jgi:hypothetical protein
VASIKDLDSSPWKDRPKLVQSAYKRVSAGEWKWRKVINEGAIRKARDAKGFPREPFNDEFRKQEKGSRKEKKEAKKVKGKKEKAGEEEEEKGEEGETDGGTDDDEGGQ